MSAGKYMFINHIDKPELKRCGAYVADNYLHKYNSKFKVTCCQTRMSDLPDIYIGIYNSKFLILKTKITKSLNS